MNFGTINEVGQLFLPLVGISRKNIYDFHIVLIEIGLKDANRKSKQKSVHLKIKDNDDFYEHAKEHLLLVNSYEQDSNIILELKVLREYEDDWNHLLKGRYSKVSKKTVSLILNQLRENKEAWRKIFKRNLKDLTEYIENTLSVNTAPYKKKEVALDTATEVIKNNLDIEIYKRVKNECINSK